MTLVHAATKSCTNFRDASADAQIDCGRNDFVLAASAGRTFKVGSRAFGNLLARQANTDA